MFCVEHERENYYGWFLQEYAVWMEAYMINFEEELKNFQPSLEVDEAEAAIYNHDLTDVTDIMTEMLRDLKHLTTL